MELFAHCFGGSEPVCYDRRYFGCRDEISSICILLRCQSNGSSVRSRCGACRCRLSLSKKAIDFSFSPPIWMSRFMCMWKNPAYAPSSGCDRLLWQIRGDFASMNLTKLNEFLADAPTKSPLAGKKSKTSGTIMKVNVDLDDYRTLVPVFIPDLEKIRAFAGRLHAKRQPWQGEAFGWSAGYNPSSLEPPPDSKMRFTPADFWIGDGAIWFFALLWEQGDDKSPVETIYDKNVVGLLE